MLEVACEQTYPNSDQVDVKLLYTQSTNIVCDFGYEGGGKITCEASSQFTYIPQCTSNIKS